MKRIHTLVIALALGIAAVAGSFAAIRSTQLGAASTTPHVTPAQFAAQSRALNRAEAALRAELRHKPPALSSQQSGAQPVTVIYHRPPAIVHVVHRRGGEHEREGLDD